MAQAIRGNEIQFQWLCNAVLSIDKSPSRNHDEQKLKKELAK